MTDMMVLRQGYVVVSGPYDARKPCQGINYSRKGMLGNLEGE